MAGDPLRYHERLRLPALLLNAAALLVMILVEGYDVGLAAASVLWVFVTVAAVASAAAHDALRLAAALNRRAVLRSQALDWLLLSLTAWVLAFIGPQSTFFDLLLALKLVTSFVGLSLRTAIGGYLARHLGNRPAQLLAFSFGVIIAAGTLLLTFPAATADGRGASLVDALFTAVSATCVTGLIVHDTASYFSRFGQNVILVLIQTGALGIMTISASAALLLGRRLGLRSRSLLASVLDQTDVQSMRGLVVYIIKMTLVVECLGALALFARFYPQLSGDQAVYYAVFHAVSAFCNAGFALWSDSLVPFRDDVAVNGVVATLIVVGGLGFTVVAELSDRDTWRRGGRSMWTRLSAHSKVVLPATGLLLAGGAIMFYFLEYRATLSGLSLAEKLMAAGFQSVTARTAGFNTVDIGALSATAVLLMVILMYVGAAPGGTGGGIKVSTAGVLLLSVRAHVLGRSDAEIFDRAVPKPVVYKAVAIAVISFLLTVIGFGMLATLEQGRFEALLFETVSAFGTVGLSMGITGSLSVAGRLLIIALMFVGRTGPLTMALAFGEQRSVRAYDLPRENILVG